MTYDLLTEPILSARTIVGSAVATLPGVMAACADGTLAALPGLRPHQGPAARDLIAKLMALASEAGELDVAHADEAAWQEALLALSGSEAAWRLVSPNAEPAFLQPPVPKGAKALRPLATHADQLDVLSTAKNHDQKGALSASEPEDWVWALVSGQTQDGFLGSGNYGVARMNGGFANRTFMHAYPRSATLGDRLRLDAERMIAARPALRTDWAERFGGAGEGHRLLWLPAWGGGKEEALPLSTLDPLFVEVCRRIRLRDEGSALHAEGIGTAAPRVDAKEQRGALMDPAASLVLDGETRKAVSLTASGLNYRKTKGLLFEAGPPLLGEAKSLSGSVGDVVIVIEGLARGQGRTEGYHAREVVVPAPAVGLARRRGGLANAFGTWSEALLTDAADARGVLRRALFALFQNTGEPDLRHGPTAAKIDPFVGRLDHAVDERFFETCFALAEGHEERTQTQWQRMLWAEARFILLDAEPAAASDTLGSYLRLPHAERWLEGGMTKRFGAGARPGAKEAA